MRREVECRLYVAFIATNKKVNLPHLEICNSLTPFILLIVIVIVNIIASLVKALLQSFSGIIGCITVFRDPSDLIPLLTWRTIRICWCSTAELTFLETCLTRLRRCAAMRFAPCVDLIKR